MMTAERVLRTDRLVLGPVDMAHFEAFAAFCASPHSAFMGGQGDRSDAWWSVATHAGQWALRGYGTYWVSAGGVPVGRVGIWHPVWLDEPELSWVIYGGHVRQGYAVEAARAVLEQWRGAPLMSLIDPANAASVAVARRLGAQREGSHAYGSGKVVDLWRHRGQA